MEFGLDFYIIAGFVVLLTGVSKSGFGAGLEMMAVPVMALYIAPQVAAGIMLPILVAIDMANIWRYRKDWDRRMVLVLASAALIGIAIGTVSFRYLTVDWIKLGLGLLAVAFVVQRLLLSNSAYENAKPGPILTVLMGAMSGFTSFLAHAGGPPSKIVLLSQNYSKSRFVGTNSYLFSIINLLKWGPYYYLGQLSVTNLTTSLSLAPFMVLGILIGFKLNSAVPQLWFNRIIITALFLVGVKLIYDGGGALI